MSQPHVLQDVHYYWGRPMDEDRIFSALSELTALNHSRVEQKTRKQRTLERRCWAYERCDQVTATCPSRPDAVGKQQGETNRENQERRVHMTVLLLKLEVRILEQRSWKSPSANWSGKRGEDVKGGAIIVIWQ